MRTWDVGSGTFCSMRRGLIGFLVAALVLLGPASAASAHDGQGGSASDYQVKVTGFGGDATGISMTFTRLGQYVRLTRTTAKQVYVLGYEGEPYLRLDSTGVWENINSPAHYLNLDRYASTTPPASANKSATPDWVKRNDGNVAEWHDHRTHWMSPTPPPQIEVDRSVEQAVPGDHHLALTVDGRPVSALISITWMPPPNRTMWLAITSLGGCLLLFGLDRKRSLVPWCAVVVSPGAVCVHGGGVAGTAVTAVVAAVALVAALRRWPLVSAATAVVSVIYSFIRIDAFSHALVSGTLTNTLARVAVAVSLGGGCAVVGAVVIQTAYVRGDRPDPDVHITEDDLAEGHLAEDHLAEDHLTGDHLPEDAQP